MRFSLIKIFNIGLAILFYFIIKFEYVNLILKYYEADGFVNQPDFFRNLETSILLGLTIIIIHLPTNTEFKYAISFFFLLFLFIPHAIFYAYGGGGHFVLYGIFLLIALISLIKFNVHISDVFLRKDILFFLMVLMIIPFIYTFRNNINLNALFFRDIYESRAIASSQGNIITGYFQSWLVKILIPITICLGLIKRNYILSLFALLLILYLYLITSEKSVFFTIFIIVFFFIGEKYVYKVTMILIVFIALIIGSHYLSKKTNNILPEVIVVERTFFDHVEMNAYYMKEFNNPLLLSHSFGKYLFNYPYKDTPERIISSKYCNSEFGNANNGFLSDGYMNFGLLGIIIWIVLLAFVINILNLLNVSERFFGIFFVISYTFLNSFLFTTLLTHGVIFGVIIMYFFLRNKSIT